MEIKDAIEHLARVMNEDVEYAQSWHGQLACSMSEEGVSVETAHKAADRFMYSTFGVSTLSVGHTRH